MTKTKKANRFHNIGLTAPSYYLPPNYGIEKKPPSPNYYNTIPIHRSLPKC